MDLTVLVQVLASLAFAAVTAAIPFIVPALARLLHIKISAQQAETIQAAAQAGAQLAYGKLAGGGVRYTVPAFRDAALAQGAQYVLDSAPQAIADLGLTEAHVTAMVTARFGGLLAADPTVSMAATPPPAAGRISPETLAGTPAA